MGTSSHKKTSSTPVDRSKIPEKQKMIYTSAGFGVAGLSKENIRKQWPKILYLWKQAIEAKSRNLSYDKVLYTKSSLTDD